MSSYAYEVDSKCWFQDKDEGWISGRVTSKKVDGETVLLEFVDDKDRTSILKTTVDVLATATTSNPDPTLPPLRNPPLLEATEDLTNLSHLNEPSVLHTILHRYSLRQIYTYSGIVLVAVNPFSSLSIYDHSVVQAYSSRRKGELEPHLFAIAEEAYRCMIGNSPGGDDASNNQTIIVSGESGAGKTVSAKYIMRYFATVDNPLNPVKKKATDTGMSEVEEAILASNPIMEAFGNAKTTRNDNSSRFGKYIEILFDANYTIVGARMRTYLLERSRVVFQPATERNYHIFYQLIAGAPSSEKKSLGLEDAMLFNYLKQGGANSVTIPGVDDSQEFKNTQSALSTVGITIERQWQMFKVLAALLHIGNIEIKGQGGRADAAIDDDDASLVLACELLGIDRFELKKWLIKKQIITRTDKIVSSLSAAQAALVRDSLAKFIYASLFDWLVANINASLVGTVPERSFIGVLDIYGFEHFDRNSFEQFCINYANEKLQQEFNAHVFKLEQEEYVQEQISWTFIDFADNQGTIDLIEGKLGILSLLDEESRMPSGSDTNFLQKLYANFDKPEQTSFKKPRFGNASFTVAHYALDVTYEAEGFLDKNRDGVPDEHMALLEKTENVLLAEILSRGTPEDEPAPPAPKPGRLAKPRKPTLVSIFKSSLSSLMATIDSTNAHYIRCIKPNEAKLAWECDAPMVLSQLRACGVLETIRISCAGYPTRWLFAEFAERYYMLLSSSAWDSEPRALCEKLLAAADVGPDRFQLGLTKIFLRAGLLARFEQLRTVRLNSAATVIQKTVKGFLQRRRFIAQRAAALCLQAQWRGALARRRVAALRRDAAATALQALLRGAAARTRARLALAAVVGVQRAARGARVRAAFADQRRDTAATTLQALLRGWHARTRFAADTRRIVYLQSCARRGAARRELAARKRDATSASHYKEVSYKLENKVVELTQSLQRRTAEHKAAMARVALLEAELAAATARHDALEGRSRALEEQLALPTVALAEHETTAGERDALRTQLAEALRQLTARNADVERLEAALETEREEREAAAAAPVPVPAADDATVAALRTEVGALREQLRQIAAGGIVAGATTAAVAGGRTLAVAQSLNSRDVGAGAMRANGANGANGVHGAVDAPAAYDVLEGPEDADSRALVDPRMSMASSTEATLRSRTIGSGTYLTDYADGVDYTSRIIELLERPELTADDVVNGLIVHLKIPTAELSLPLSPKEIMFPAHLVSLVLNEMWKHGLMHESEKFIAAVMHAVQNQVTSLEGEEALATGIFWMSNVHEILSFVSVAESDILQGIYPNEETTYSWEDYEKLVPIVRHDLESLEFNVYHAWITEAKKLFAKMVIPALIDSQSLPGFMCPEPAAAGGGRLFNRLVGASAGPAYTMDDVLLLLDRIWTSLGIYYIEHSVTAQAVTELCRLIGVTAFNELLMRRNFSSWKRAMQIQYNITRLEEWCKSHGMHEGTLQLEHLMQATKLLQLKKGLPSDIDIIYDVCWILTPTQVQKLLTNYFVADYETGLSPEILKLVNSRVKPDDKSDFLLLSTDFDGTGIFELPMTREVSGIETFVPAWLHVPNIRELVQCVSSSAMNGM